MAKLRAFRFRFVSKTVFRFSLATAVMLSLFILGGGLLRQTQLAAGAKNKAGSAARSTASATHRLVATYYSVKNNLQATLMLSNQGPTSLPVQLSLFNRSGAQNNLPPITMSGHEVRAFDLRQHITPGSGFEEGSVQVEYQGMPLELGGVVNLVDSAQSLVFDEELTEPAKAFASARLEGVWWVPSANTEIRLALSNTSNAQLSVKLSTKGEGQGDAAVTTLTLAPRETRILSTEKNQGRVISICVVRWAASQSNIPARRAT